MKLSGPMSFLNALTFLASLLFATSVDAQQKTRFTVYGGSDVETEIMRALKKEASVDYFEIRFEDVITELSGGLGHAIMLHESALDNNLDQETLISRTMSDESFTQIIQEISGEYECAFSIQNEVVMIVSKDHAITNLDTRVYDCKKLIDEKLGADSSRLLELIQRDVDPDSWQDVGGESTIAEFEGVLVINQMSFNHQKIEQALEKLDGVSSSVANGQTESPARFVKESHESIVDALAKQCTEDYFEATLGMIAKDLSKVHSIELGFHSSTEAIGMGKDTLVTLAVENVSVQSFLLLLCDRFECTLGIVDDELQFMSREHSWKTESLLEWRYDVSEIAEGEKANELVELLKKSVYAGLWDDSGGNATIETAMSELTISQTLESHARIYGILNQIHKAVKDD